MSEAAPGLPDSPAFATPERAALADAVRALIDAVMTIEDADADDAARRRATTSTSSRSGSAAAATTAPATSPRSHGDYLPRSPDRRRGEPALAAHRLGRRRAIDGSRASRRRARSARAYEGPPGLRARRAGSRCAFDEMLGIANIAAGHPGMTARLTVHYRQPDAAVPRAAVPGRGSTAIEGRRIMSPGRALGRRDVSPPRPTASSCSPARSWPSSTSGIRVSGGRPPASDRHRTPAPKHDAGRLKLSPAHADYPVMIRCPGCSYLVPQSLGHVPAVRDDDPRPGAGRGRRSHPRALRVGGPPPPLPTPQPARRGAAAARARPVPNPVDAPRARRRSTTSCPSPRRRPRRRRGRDTRATPTSSCR